MTTAADLLKIKSHQTVFSIAPDARVFEALQLMAEKDIGALVVLEGERVVGILSERDYARKVILRDRSSRETPVRDIMSTHVLYARPDQNTDECMAVMSANRLRHLPVVDDGRLVGMVSIGDLVKNTISEQQFIIGQLEHYITGAR